MTRFNPQSVTSLTATVDSINSITLNWTNGEQNGCQIQRSIPLASANANPTNFQTLALIAAGVTTYADTTVQAGSFYVYRVTTLPESDALMFTPAKGVEVSATTTGMQPHLDTSRPNPAGMGNEFSYKPFVILDGASANPQPNSAEDSNPPIVDPTCNGVPYNS